MNGFKSAFVVLCLGAVCASAYSQEFAEESSELLFGVYTGAGVSITNASYVIYQLGGTYAAGSGSNYSFLTGGYALYSFAENESFAGPGSGYARTGSGFEQYLTFTNDNPTGGGSYFSVYTVFLEEFQLTSANAYAIDFGGIAEFGGEYFYGFNTVTVDGLGPASVYSYNWTVTAAYSVPGYALTESQGGFRDYLAFGQSITVGIWASGITSATSSGPVPAPAAIAPFAVGLLAAIRRRKKS